jgi:hypothetical protein
MFTPKNGNENEKTLFQTTAHADEGSKAIAVPMASEECNLLNGL